MRVIEPCDAESDRLRSEGGRRCWKLPMGGIVFADSDERRAGDDTTSDKGESGEYAESTFSCWLDGQIELDGEVVELVVEVVETEGVYGRLGSALPLTSGRGAAGG